jgi:N-succinyldiaminopimelate aminotransferase
MVATRLHGIPPTIFAEMSALAVRTGSVNLGQGFPDEDGPPEVVAAAVRAMQGGANQYAPGIGVPALRRAIAEHQHRHYGLELDPDTQVAVTTGCTEAIAAALLGLVEPGDEVVVLEPYYDSYLAMLQMAGGTRRPVTLRSPDFRVDLDELRAAVTPRTRFVLLNSPHNPTGTVLTRAELQAVADLAVEHDLTVITDEVYEHLVYDGSEHVPVATLPGMAERTLTLSSVGKSYSLTGWKVGWATGPAHLVGALVAAKQWLTYTSGAPLQPAVAVALTDHPDWPPALARDLQERRDLLVTGLVAAGLPTTTPQGTYFATSDVRELGWAQVFYDDPRGPGRHLVRWAFCKRREVLTEATDRLAAADLRR